MIALTSQEFRLYKLDQEIDQKKNQKIRIYRNIEMTAGHLQQSFFMIVFGFFTTPAGKALLMSKHLINHNLPLQIILFPIAALFELAELTSAALHYYRTPNRHLMDSAVLAAKTVKVSMITTAILMGTAGTWFKIAALSAIVPYFFAGTLAAYTVFYLGLTLYHLKKLFDKEKVPKNSKLYLEHKHRFINHLITTMTLIVFVGVITTLFVLGVSSGIGLGITAGIGIATIVTSLLCRKVIAIYHKHDAQEEKSAEDISKSIGKTEEDDDTNEALGSKDDFFYIYDYSTSIKSKSDFIEIIDKKIAKLESALSNEAPTNRNRCFRVFFPNEKNKRDQKIKALTELKKLIEENQENNRINNEKIDNIIKENPKIFHSFFHNKGEVEVIFDTVRYHFIRPLVHEKVTQKPQFADLTT